ncbi:hypothetical protein HCC61_15205 [Streptomyces sp. HNM0575]|uniref:VOC family protein n=1 Tax=Streptomyces sp. HNM0575 TaxID=2716338 RepID=UPI00145D4772|nr:VOC family protein [Streptomyces sp. HNM0575]NLU74012.1 hypothetical protein [Streptomyces sp. HNM0575]
MVSRLPAMHHVGIVVEDVATAFEDFERRWGLRPAGSREVTFEEALVNGRETTFTAHYGFLAVGETQIELIAPVSGDSPYTEFLLAHGEGLHHLAFVVGSIDDQLGHVAATDKPCSIVTAGELPGLGRFVYADGAAHGTLIELIQATGPASGGDRLLQI